MTETILITGSTGFVGRQVLKALAEQSVKIRVVVRKGKELQINMTDQIESVVSTPDLFAEPQKWWKKVCTGVDKVIHIAWYAEPGKYLQSLKNIDCLCGTLEMAKACVQANVKRFILKCCPKFS